MKRLFVFILLISVGNIWAESQILETYVETGLANNLALQQKTFSLKQSAAALNEARGMFLPSVTLDTRYSRADGGRMIDLPIGDLMNPVYQSLNSLLQQDVFPSIKNQQIAFLREEEHDTKVRVIQPLFQPAVIYNHRIKSDLRDMAREERNSYKRQLISEIKTAYFNHLKTVRLVDLLDETEGLLRENVRVANSLFKNDKVTKAEVYRAEAELHGFHKQQAEAEKGKILSASYFNFLLNRPLDSAIEIDTTIQILAFQSQNLEEGIERALQKREELTILKEVVSLSGHNIRLNQTSFLPGITAVFDYGYQGEKYRFDKQDDYWMASLIASWNVFNGFQDKFKVDQAKFAKKERESQFAEVNKQIELQVTDAYHSLLVAEDSKLAAESEERSANKSFEMIARMYKEGIAPQISYMDARNAKTRAEVGAVNALYDLLIKQAEWEKSTAAIPLSAQGEGQ